MYHAAKGMVRVQILFACKGRYKFMEIGVKPHNVVEQCYVL